MERVCQSMFVVLTKNHKKRRKREKSIILRRDLAVLGVGLELRKRAAKTTDFKNSITTEVRGGVEEEGAGFRKREVIRTAGQCGMK